MIKNYLSKIQMPNFVIFDLDDTLYKEINYVKSGFNAVSAYISNHTELETKIVFDKILNNYYSGGDAYLEIIKELQLNISKDKMISIYRSHNPSISLDEKTKNVLDFLYNNNELKGILTDGRTIQQQNKINALGLNEYFIDIVISEEFGSEKPNVENYSHFMSAKKDVDMKYYYVGDNLNKDFIPPNKLGWVTICLKDNGQNIHGQDFTLEKEYLPKYTIDKISDLLEIINEK